MNQYNGTKSHLKKYDHKVFANRNVYLYHMQCYGFDLDFTLTEYRPAELEELIFEFAKKNLIKMGYPLEIGEIKFDPTFAFRGVIFDNYYGNILKVDPYGFILLALHGLRYLKKPKINEFYPSRFVDMSHIKRFIIFNTLFDIPIIYMLSALISHFESDSAWRKIDQVLERDHFKLTYQTIQTDVDYAVKTCHEDKTLKNCVINNFDKYINKQIELPILLHRIRKNGKKSFLVTNSDYWYTNHVMEYLFDWPLDQFEEGMNTDWRQYFDMIIVDAKKPSFFTEGSILKRVDTHTGNTYVGTYIGSPQRGEVYQGGNAALISEMLQIPGKNIIYMGDHIFGDILKSKKRAAWRTFLVIPELHKEIDVWRTKKEKFDAVKNLETLMAEKFKKNNSSTNENVDVTEISQQIEIAVVNLENCYGEFGSLMRCGEVIFPKVLRYADLYSYSCYNLLYHPFNYFYGTPWRLLPHESTVKQVKPKKRHSIKRGIIQTNNIMLEEE